MALNSTHPNYATWLGSWTLMRDAYQGEQHVKNKGQLYLPATPGMRLDKMDKATDPGMMAYEAYKLRAVFPDYVPEALSRYLGMLHHKEAVIELPAAMEAMRDNATNDGESLQALLRRINEQQLLSGRLAIMLDFQTDALPGAMPYVALYYTEAVRNWDESRDGVGRNQLTLCVLDESGPVRLPGEFDWKQVERYRVLKLDNPVQPAETPDNGTAPPSTAAGGPAHSEPPPAPGSVVYMQGLFEVDDGENPLAYMTPQFRGRPLDVIPLVFINSKDLLPTPDTPPLLGLGRLCMTIYRGEADYRQTLFMQSQDTLVTIGQVIQNGEAVAAGDAVRVGAHSRISLDPAPGADAKYVGIGAEGIEGQRAALESDRKEAQSRSGTMIAPGAGKQESGDAMTTRVASQTASLTQIAKTGAAGLQALLRIAAQWMGQDPEKVVVTPNLEFATQVVTGQEISQLIAARTMGAPISLESIHGVMRDRGLTKFEYEMELDKIEVEDANRAKRLEDMGLNADGSVKPEPGDDDDSGNKPPGAA